jgi:hypothetical protein
MKLINIKSTVQQSIETNSVKKLFVNRVKKKGDKSATGKSRNLSGGKDLLSEKPQLMQKNKPKKAIILMSRKCLKSSA